MADYVKAPEVKYEPLHEVTMYQARCTSCGQIEDDYGDFSAWADPDTPVTDVVDNRDWFALYVEGAVKVLLCPECIKCEVCEAEQAYNVGGHLVCEDHEDYDWKEDHGDAGERSTGLPLQLVRDD